MGTTTQVITRRIAAMGCALALLAAACTGAGDGGADDAAGTEADTPREVVDGDEQVVDGDEQAVDGDEEAVDEDEDDGSDQRSPSQSEQSPAPADGAAGLAPQPPFSPIEGVTTISDYSGEPTVDQWLRRVPGIQDVRVTSRLDGQEQPLLYLPPSGEGLQPLLVVVHSFSYGYEQHLGIPFAQWAAERGWAMIHPDFRGPFDRPEATGSDLAVADVLDAVDFAVAQGGIHEGSVFVIGVSGGGMMSLLMAGRHPDRFAGAVSWVPIHDLVEWYRYNVEEQPQRHYRHHITASCGGDPAVDPRAGADCTHRSPVAHLDAARQAGLPVYIGHGLDDRVVPPSHAAGAFNQLAHPADRLAPAEVAVIGQGRLPEHLQGAVEAETYFSPQDPGVFMARDSGPVTLVLFEGGHNMAYNPGLAWMVDRLGAR